MSAQMIELESDLPSVASQAAIELDNLILRRSVERDAIKKLASKLSLAVADVHEPSAPASLLDVGTAVAINRAIGESTGPESSTLDELLAKTRELTSRMLSLTADEVNAPEHESELRDLRGFCVSLAQNALTMEMSPYEPEHPFRRHR